jgi:hypothetical protein
MHETKKPRGRRDLIRDYTGFSDDFHSFIFLCIFSVLRSVLFMVVKWLQQ